MSLTGTTPFKLYRALALGSSGNGVEVTTLAATLTMSFLDEQFQSLNPNGSNRTVTLPVPDPEHRGVFFVLYNAGALGDLAIKDSANTIITLGTGGSCIVACTSTAWKIEIASPGIIKLAAASGAPIPVVQNGSLPITQNGPETNTLPIPTYLGQTLSLFVDTDTSGARVVTSAARINQAGNTIMTLSDVGDFIKLEAITIAGALRWQVIANDGVILS